MNGYDVIAFTVLIGPLVGGLVVCATTIRMVRALARLADVRPTMSGNVWPKVSIIVPACNEQERIERALNSMLAMDYGDLELIVVDDRSSDRTGEIVDAVAARDPRVKAIHLTALREGWLGKLAAMHEGVTRATGDFLLFIDADVLLEPSALAKAVAHMERRGRDFLSAIPTIASAGLLGDALFAFAQSLVGTTRPWSIPDPESPAIAATGAFMLVRRTAFDASPGLEWLRLEVADDFGLCLLIKAHGGVAELVNGRGAISLVWYASFGEMMHAMQKNLFAITGRFSILRMSVQVVASLCLALFPLVLLMPLSHTSFFGVAVLTTTLAWTTAMVLASAWSGRSVWPAFLLPVSALGMAFMTARAAIVGVRIGGIRWRGVVYETALLARHQRVKL